jgi:RimJ/RimL family protein N-acetyltransferase
MSDEAPAPLDRLAWPLRTERLTLRRATPADAETVRAYRAVPSVAHWLSGLWNDPAEWEAIWVRRHRRTLLAELDGRVIGDLGLHVLDPMTQREVAAAAAGTEGEIAWAFDPTFHGRGYATEAVRELIRIAFSELGLRRLIADCFADNERSWRLMERVGMRRESHTVRSALHRDGVWRDFFVYGILAPDE